MSLPIICPACGAGFPAEAGLQDADARRALAAALALWPAPLKSGVLVYLGLHAPEKKRIGWAKLTRLIVELTELVGSGQVVRNRETRPAPVAAWGEGLATILEMRDSGKLDLPLDGHGLLCEIVHRKASKAAGQHQAATRPLHPSHRPAESREDWQASKRSGAVHVGALLGALKPTVED